MKFYKIWRLEAILKRMGFRRGRVWYVWFRDIDCMMAHIGGPDEFNVAVSFSIAETIKKKRDEKNQS